MGRARRLALLGLAFVAVGPGARRVVRSWPHRIAVEGTSMAPTLLPGDWLLVDPAAYRRHGPGVGDLVVAPDPRVAARLLVKRVHAVAADGALDLRGDATAASTDSRAFGLVAGAAVEGRAWARYWPLRRVGLLP
ncbi:MAG TPA: nickel-type superoxide dismutase maturation protease [Candidatus Sulfotelmatobacter sp.]|nr:nickel-type superoxide dismutase maturation protease [Candidatus Sulfotelmatobacter sp.]